MRYQEMMPMPVNELQRSGTGDRAPAAGAGGLRNLVGQMRRGRAQR